MSSNNTLINLTEKRQEYVVKIVSQKLSDFIQEDILWDELKKRFKSNYAAIESMEKNVNLDEFRKVMNSPQIDDLLSDYLCYLLTIAIMGIQPKKRIFKDEIINYIIGVIEKNFAKVSENYAVLAIRQYFDLIFIMYREEFSDNIYSKFIERKSGKVIHTFFEKESSEEKLLKRYENHINQIIDKNFIVRVPGYESIKREYTKIIKNYYQNGFIYLLGEYKFNEFYIPPILANGLELRHVYWRNIQRGERIQRDKRSELWKHIFDDRDIVYVVGGAGYGKSLFLKNLINEHTKLNIKNCQDYLLIYCDLKSYYKSENQEEKTMVEFFRESMISISGKEGITKEFIQYFLDIGRCIILLDALDEVPKDKRNNLHKKIISFLAICNPNNKVCITSRDRGFIPQKEIDVLEILPLSEKDIENYIDKMIALKKFKKEEKETFMKQAQALIEKDFLNNFLILSLLVNIYKAEKELPENKIDLYKKCFEYIAKKREEEKSKTGYDWNSIYPLMKDSTFISLSTLAVPNNKDIERKKIEETLLKLYKNKYIDQARAECAIKEFLEFCSNRTELFVLSSADDKFKFFHRSFFEYFYSRYIYQQNNVSQMYNLLKAFDIDSEVFELTVALVKEDNEEKYQQLIEFIIEKAHEELSKTPRKTIAFGILTVAMQVIDDVQYIKQYFDLVILYHNAMSEEPILGMNQKFICMWLDKIICSDEEQKQKFLETYRGQCIKFILNLLAHIGIDSTNEIEIINSEGIRTSVIMEYQMSIVSKSFPFYVSLWGKYGDFYGMMEELSQKGHTSIKLGGLKNLKMIKALNNYKRMSPEKKEKFFRLLSMTGCENQQIEVKTIC